MMTKTKKSWLIAVILLLLVIITGAVVINASLSITSDTKADKKISLTANAPIYNINYKEPSEKENSLPQVFETSTASDIHGGLSVYDSDKVWTTNTKVNIFEHNDSHVSTDGTGSAEHIIAPGTENNYTFSLDNDKEYAIKYTLDISGSNDSAYDIPVMLQILDAEGNSLSGDMKPISELNSIADSGSIKPYTNAQYQIRWKWDFENGTDDYDTLLGNKAVEEEIACHININVISEYDYDSSASEWSDSSNTPSDGNPVKTGDSRNIMLYILTAVLGIGIFALVFSNRKKYNEDTDK